MTGSRIAALSVALAAIAAPLPALAGTIAFATVAPGAWAGHTEDGFDVTATGGVWTQFILGNPLYSILSVSPAASLMLTASGGGEFTFESIDLRAFGAAGGGYGGEGLAPGTGVFDYAITGFHSGSSVLSIAGAVSGSGEFETVLGTSPVALDALAIAFTAVTSSGFNVDNIVLGTPVPEPTPAISIGLGLLVLTARARRRSA